MKKDGFTLIEILLVLVILVTVSVAGTFAIQNIQKKSNEERLSELYKEIESATDVYLSENDAFLKDILNKEVDEKCIRIYTLQNEGLLSNTLTNPVTNKLIPANLCVMVYMKSDGTISSSFNESDEKKTITLNVINGTSDNSTKSGYNKVVFNVTPNAGYLNELETNTCNGTLNGSTYTIDNITSTRTCSISFKLDPPPEGSTLVAAVKHFNPKVETRTSFSSVLTSDTTGTIFTSTENGTTVYYFAGNTEKNWVKFGKYEKEHVVYRGYYSSTSTNFKEYQTLDACTSASSYNTNCTLYKFASTGDDIYWRIIRTNEDGSIRLLYHGTSTTSTDAYISSPIAFNSTYNDSKYVGYMYDSNGSNSTIKNTIDSWYANNLTKYTNYLSTTAIYCNDRTSTGDDSYTRFGALNRLFTNKTPTYDCTNTSDAFSVSNSSAKLTYPIGLMTADEISFAGGLWQTKASAYYYQNSAGSSSTGDTWWYTMSPSYWFGSFSYVFFVDGSGDPGDLCDAFVSGTYGVRPAISLKSCIKYGTGDGSAGSPYTIDESYEC